MHSKFIKGSSNLNITNGVGILPDGNIILAIKEKINFYDFATFFKEKGCKNALDLDGFVSNNLLSRRKYYKSRWKFWSDNWRSNSELKRKSKLMFTFALII